MKDYLTYSYCVNKHMHDWSSNISCTNPSIDNMFTDNLQSYLFTEELAVDNMFTGDLFMNP